MGYTLIESRARSPQRSGGALVSVGVHTALIGAAVALTARSGLVPVPVHPDVVAVLYAAPTPAPPRTPPRVAVPATAPVPQIAMPSVAPAIVPAALPAVAAPVAAAAPNPGPAAMPPGTVAPGPWAPGGSTGTGGEIWHAEAVDRAVEPSGGNPRPAYPGVLRAAHVEGTVDVQFVVDTAGHIEPGSIGVLRSTHALFTDAVLAALARSRYRPAEAEGHRVRQLVAQRFVFALQR